MLFLGGIFSEKLYKTGIKECRETFASTQINKVIVS